STLSRVPRFSTPSASSAWAVPPASRTRPPRRNRPRSRRTHGTRPRPRCGAGGASHRKGAPMTTANPGDVRYVTVDELSASLTDVHVLDEGLADWACTTVTALAASITRRAWSADAVPPPVRAICGLAARRLYANPDRFTRENTPEYGYAL